MFESTRVLLTIDDVDDLIYSARVGDLEALKEDITRLSSTHNCSAEDIILAAVDRQPESEGGTGACLLHYPAANGNIEIVNYLLGTLNGDSKQRPSPQLAKLIDLRNYSGNTPLHWAAINTQLECVKALVNAGADVRAKNQDGHDAAFLAERTEWDAAREGDEESNGKPRKKKEVEGEEFGVEVSTEEERQEKPLPPMSKAMQVVHHLLELDSESPEKTDHTAAAAAAAAAEASSAVPKREAMEGVEKTA
ncbi:hypothetical protein KEM54_005514 [Ascosphaera aggregata]|nr:hypothetical protein KEM54_005514 [Ascosphaera aggregata]